MTARLRSERGFTLMELLVAMTVGVVVLGGALTMVTMSARGSRRVQQRVDAQARGRVGTEQVLRPLHAISCLGTTPAILYASPTLLAFNADLAGGSSFTPDQHALGSVTSGGVTSIRLGGYTAGQVGTTPTTTAPAWPATTMKSLVDDVVDPATATVPLFTYYGPSADGLSLQQLNATPSLSVADLAKVGQIDVSFAVRPSEAGERLAPPVTFTSSLYPREEQVNQSTSFPLFAC